MEDNIKRIKEKTIPALCDFVERACKETTSEKELEILPEVVKGISFLINTIY